MIVFTFILNTIYVFLILEFVQHIVFTNRHIIYKILAATCSSLLLLTLPKHELFYFANLVLTILLCFPFRKFIQAIFVALCTASLLGGMLFILSNIWPQSSFGQLILFLVLTLFVLLQLIQFIRQWSQRNLNIRCTIRLLGECYEVKGFIDSGNGCIEPISKQPVHFIKLSTINKQSLLYVFPLLEQWAKNNSLDNEASTLFKSLGCRFIQFQTIDSTSSTSIAFPGEWGQANNYAPCFFIFIEQDQPLPHQAEIVFHQSLLHHSLLKEGTI